MATLKDQLIRLGYECPELRHNLTQVLDALQKQAASNSVRYGGEYGGQKIVDFDRAFTNPIQVFDHFLNPPREHDYLSIYVLNDRGSIVSGVDWQVYGDTNYPSTHPWFVVDREKGFRSGTPYYTDPLNAILLSFLNNDLESALVTASPHWGIGRGGRDQQQHTLKIKQFGEFFSDLEGYDLKETLRQAFTKYVDRNPDGKTPNI